MDPFVQQLAALCRAHVTRNKWVFVPTHSLGRTLGERVALGGTNWLNLRFVTPLDIALRMGAPFLVERGIDPSEEGLGPALVMGLLMELPGAGGYFRPLADHPTLAQALWTTIRELRMAGLRAHDLPPSAFESPAKHAELVALLSAYERFLETHQRGDMALVFEEALRHPEWCPIQGDDCWTDLPDAIWPPLPQRLLDALPGDRLSPRALAIAGGVRPRRLSESLVERVVPDRAGNPLAFVLTPAAMPAGAGVPCGEPRPPGAEVPGTARRPPGAGVSLFHAGGREAEIDEVCRRILAAGAPLDQVEIACASDAHAALIWEKALRYEWKVTLGSGIPAAATRPGRALIGLCDWIETDFSAGHLRRLLQSGDLGLEKEDEGFTAGEAARILARAEAGWGRATYGLALGGLRRSDEARAKDADLSADDRAAAAGRAAQTSVVLDWLTALIDAVPVPTSAGVPLQGVVEAALRFVERTTARSSQLDHLAGSALVDHVGELRGLGAYHCPLPQALRFVRERVESLQVAADRPRPGHLHACRLSQSGYSGRPHRFVVGLEEGRVFPGGTEDAVLLDAERTAIHPGLRRSTDRVDEGVWSALSRLATWSPDAGAAGSPVVLPAPRVPEAEPRTPSTGSRAPVRITLSYACRDTREFRETYASWLMLQAFRLRRGDRALSYPAMKAALGEPASSLPSGREASSSRGAWWLRSVVGAGDAGIQTVGPAFAAVACGRAADRARQSEAFTSFDGYVPEAGACLDPSRAENVFSVTELESAAGCPFRFFLKRGLGIRPVVGRERDRDVWLDPLTRGSELHEIYAALWRRCRDDGRRPSMKKDAAWLAALADSRLASLQQEMPAATTEIFDREREDFLSDVELFLEGECEDARRTPIAVEVSFGRPLGEHEEPLARSEPVTIDLGGGLRFRVAGRIDRIDQVGPGTFEVLDYKTGGYWRDAWKGTFNGGRRLQHALYGLAAVELLKGTGRKPKVTAGVYYFTSHKGRRERRTIPAPAARETAAVLADLRDVIVSGAFVHAPDGKKDCRFCDFTAACGPRVHGQSEGKQEDASLRAYARLAAHD